MLPETRGKPLPDFINKETSEQEEELVTVEDKSEVTGYASSVQSERKKLTGPEGNSEFCFPRISVFPETRDQSLSDLLYSKTKQK